MTGVVSYGQFRFDVYLITAVNGKLEDQRVIANFGTDQLAHEFAVWYAAKHQAQILINDLRTDALVYVPELTARIKYAMQPPEVKAVPVIPPSTKRGHSKTAAVSPVNGHKPAPVAEAPSASTRDIAIALLRVLRDKDAKPWPARKVAEKAGMQYTVDVRRTLLKLRDKGLVIFDNGRWIKA